jgi:hypothetical protein
MSEKLPDSYSMAMDDERRIIRSLLQKPIAFNPMFARVTGSVTSGLLLSQLFFWSDKGKDPDGWIYKTSEEIESETTLTRHEQESARRRLQQVKVCEIKVKGVPPTMHYRIDFDALCNLISNLPESGKLNCHNPANQFAENRQTIKTEITAETTAQDLLRSSSSSKNSYDLGFDHFYTLYPRKTGKAAALRAWQKIRPDKDLRFKIAERLRTFIAIDWCETPPRFIPHPATWLNAGRWEDEVPSADFHGPSRHTNGLPDYAPEWKEPEHPIRRAKTKEERDAEHAEWKRQQGFA